MHNGGVRLCWSCHKAYGSARHILQAWRVLIAGHYKKCLAVAATDKESRSVCLEAAECARAHSCRLHGWKAWVSVDVRACTCPYEHLWNVCVCVCERQKKQDKRGEWAGAKWADKRWAAESKEQRKIRSSALSHECSQHEVKFITHKCLWTRRSFVALKQRNVLNAAHFGFNAFFQVWFIPQRTQ